MNGRHPAGVTGDVAHPSLQTPVVSFCPGLFACQPDGVPVADTIICVDCGGICHRTPFEPPELGWRRGDVVTYRCPDCADMWYLEVDDDDLDAGADPLY